LIDAGRKRAVSSPTGECINWEIAAKSGNLRIIEGIVGKK